MSKIKDGLDLDDDDDDEEYQEDGFDSKAMAKAMFLGLDTGRDGMELDDND